MHKDLGQLLQPLIKSGYQLIPSGKHSLLRDPDGRLVRDGDRLLVIPSTPSDYRSIRNLRAQLRRAGLLRR